MMWRAETDARFYDRLLRAWGTGRHFVPEREASGIRGAVARVLAL